MKPNSSAQADQNPACEAAPALHDGNDVQSSPDCSVVPELKSKSCLKRIWSMTNAFLDSMDKEEDEKPEPFQPQKKTRKESIQEFTERCRDRRKRIEMLKGFGEWCWMLFSRGLVLFFLFTLTILATICALDFSKKNLISFFPPNEVMDYLAAEHESLEATAYQITPLVGKNEDIPFARFNAKCIETVKPIKIRGDEYGIYLMTSKGWYNGDDGIFSAKDVENMPPDISWGLIEGRIYTYTLFD